MSKTFTTDELIIMENNLEEIINKSFNAEVYDLAKTTLAILYGSLELPKLKDELKTLGL